MIGGATDGNGHPHVGAIGPPAPGLASGVLISPTVVLTAGHATDRRLGPGQARVTFDPVADASATWHTATAFTNPAFTQRQDDPGDLGVVVLDQPVEGITPAQLPTASLLDGLAAHGLHNEVFTVVGYGISRLLGGDDGGGKPRPDRTSGGTRKVAHESFLSLTPGWLRLLMHEDGQTCLGDSCSPVHLGAGNLIAAISITGDAACESTDAHARLDTPSARAFLGQYVALPYRRKRATAFASQQSHRCRRRAVPLWTTCEHADGPRADCCFALAKQSSNEAGPAHLVVVRSGGRPHLRVGTSFRVHPTLSLRGALGNILRSCDRTSSTR
jgi:Trypsin